MLQRIACCLASALVCALAGSASAATLPPGFTETSLATTLARPTSMAIAPDGRVFVCEQAGRLRVIKNGALLSTPFHTLTVDSDGERGLLGVAFHPDFTSNGVVYVYHTLTSSPPRNRVSILVANGDVSTGVVTPIMDLDQLSGATNHNGGAIHFGPDGKLYVAVGDNANGSNAPSLSTRHGKVLRINPDGTIPADNPFFNTAIGDNRAIWAIGLRNPFTFAFRPGSAQVFINDVGASTFEEINEGVPGANYGWPATEGPNPPGVPNVRYPRFSYETHVAGTCAIAGGAFYSPSTSQFPADFANDYFFADLCAGWIRRLDLTTNTATDFATGIDDPVDLLVANDGSLYYLAGAQSNTSGRLVRVQFTGGSGGAPPAPVLTAFTNALTLSLSWSNSAGATSYRLEAGTASGGTNLFNANIGNIRTIEGVVPAATYFVRVRAVGAQGTSPASNEVQVNVSGGGVCATPPPVPTGYTAQASGLNASFSWSPSPSATFYVLEAGSTSGAANLFQGSVGLVTLLSAAGPAGAYFTRVRAANACGVSAPSVERTVNLTCNAAAPTGLTATKAGTIVTFRWNASGGATSYRIQVGSGSGLSNLLNVDVGPGTAITVNTAGAPIGTYFIRIVAQTACGLTGPSNQVTVSVP